MRGNPTIGEALREAAAALQNRKEAEILLSCHMQKERLWLITHDDLPLPDPEAYFALVTRREKAEPIEYITGSVSFYGEDFTMVPGVLIPRPETELLIEKAGEVIEMERPKSIAEIGTGSGIISIMLARRFPNLEITATDINPEAIRLAQHNAVRFGVEDRITFVETPYLEGINRELDMIVSNPPYIARDFPLEAPLLHEPQNALFGGERGDEMLCEIIDIAISRGVRTLACEMGYDQRAPLTRYMQGRGIADFKFYRDYSGFDRGFVAMIEE